ncbi:hypothetical protein ACHQM5_011247 [Ranunculus cassubicifolius]
MSAPPFQLEDQTDEDFFDKLVDDEFGGDEPGLESDDIQAFNNLSINEVGTMSEDFGGFVSDTEKDQSKDVGIASSAVAQEKDILVSEESVSLVSDNVDNAVVGYGNGASLVSESATKGGEGCNKPLGFKEVQWSSFYDPVQNGVGSDDIFANLGISDADPFASIGDDVKPALKSTPAVAGHAVSALTLSSDSAQNQDGQVYVASNEHAATGQDIHTAQYTESEYPGWWQDPNTKLWYQIDGYDTTTNTQFSYGENAQEEGNHTVSGQNSEVSYLQQTAQSVSGTFTEESTTASVSTLNQQPQQAITYPAHMVFDPQFPEWYFDTITNQWVELASYHQALQSASIVPGQQQENQNNTNGIYSSQEHNLYGDGHVESHISQNRGAHSRAGSWASSAGDYSQQNANLWQPETVSQSNSVLGITENQNSENLYGSRGHRDSTNDQHRGFRPAENTSMYEQANRSYGGNDAVTGFQSSFPSDNRPQHFTPSMLEPSQNNHSSHDFYGSQTSGFYSQQFQPDTQPLYNTNEERSSAGRPPHALVTFGFGGKLIVMKESSSHGSNSVFGNQGTVGGSISVLNIMEVVGERNDTTQSGPGADNYFRTLCQQSYPGPLAGGSVGAKEAGRWIDERITKTESPHMDYRKGELLKLLLSLLKIASQNYGKLRTPYSPDPSTKKSDSPEAAVGNLLKSFRENNARVSGYGATSHSLQTVPSEPQLLATTVAVEELLMSGKSLEALQCAREGQLWGFALALSFHINEQEYIETARQMAKCMFVGGSPMRALSLLMAGHQKEIFNSDEMNSAGVPFSVHMPQQHAQSAPSGLLDDWERNLAIITANRTKDDERVIMNLGDLLWKERWENIAAHICYLLAEANFEPYSDAARLCLLGADHWKFPRTYASPEAIQRTEFYEYSMVLGNSQSVLLPFQPYKLIYAYMLAEVGKLSDSLKYCQSTLKMLKTNRSPEVEPWKKYLSSLEDRIKAHQQSGFGTNLIPKKLVGKFLPFIDSTIHRMVGTTPPPAPSGEQANHSLPPRVTSSQSTMAMQSLIPSSSMEPINAWATNGGTRTTMPNRSISEPDFGRSPRQEASSSNSQGRTSDSAGPSRIGRIGSTLLGWVARTRPDKKQAKLGEENKFYYDEKLKRWVEAGAPPPAEEMAPPPPPTSASFHNNGTSSYHARNSHESPPGNGGSPPSSELRSGIPPIPPSSNQFSARARTNTGVRARYVDTFNKGGGTQAQTQARSPSIPTARPGVNAKKPNTSFFIPTPTSDHTTQALETTEEEASTNQEALPPPTFMSRDSFSSPPPQASSMQRFPSMNNITPSGRSGGGGLDNGNNGGSLSSRSRRTASWSGSGSFSGALNQQRGVISNNNEIRPLGEALGMSPLSYNNPAPPTMHIPANGGGNYGDDLQEVEL